MEAQEILQDILLLIPVIAGFLLSMLQDRHQLFFASLPYVATGHKKTAAKHSAGSK